MTTATVRLTRPEPSSDLDAVLAEIDRHLGPGVATTLNNGPAPVGAIPTGSLSLDLALGAGGIPRGRITEIYGPEGAGKTTLALSVIAQAQAAGGSAGYIDTEHALDPGWAATTGVDLARLVLCRPEHGEQALQVASLLIGSGAVAALVVDSIAALVPRAELAADIGERLPGVQAHLLSQGLRQLCGPIARSGTAVLVTNQLRQRAGAPGTPVTPPGGGRLATTPQSGWMCAASRPSPRAGGWSGAACGCWWPRTSSARPARRPSSKSGRTAASASRPAGWRIQPGRPASVQVDPGGLARQGEGQGHQPAGGVLVARDPFLRGHPDQYRQRQHPCPWPLARSAQGRTMQLEAIPVSAVVVLTERRRS